MKWVLGLMAMLGCPLVGAAEGVLLSEEGCGRATGYAEANKIVSWGGVTHAAWLDSPEEGFRVRVATLNHETGAWSEAVTVGEGYDNHGGPALTVDSEGYLHIVYYPHHHAMRYRKSLRPNDASAWREEVEFGERLTYPTLVCGEDDRLYFTARRSFSGTEKGRPWEVELWTKGKGGEWELEGSILRSRHAGYAHFQESLAWGPERKTLHLACRFHEKSDKEAYGRIQTVGYMVSRDFGKSWEKSDGTAVATPASVDEIDVLERGGVDAGIALRAGAMAVDRKGVPHLVYSIAEGEAPGRTVIARPGGDGNWNKLELAEFVPGKWEGWTVEMAGGLAFNDDGVLVGVATVQKPAPGEKTWGHASNEVLRFESWDGGKSFEFRTMSEVSGSVSHWLPSIERETGWNRVPLQPGVIYTAGGAGEKNTQLLRNRVLWSR